MRFLSALLEAKKLNKNVVITDIKCRSPKEGDLLCGRKPEEVAKELIRAGAPCVSVVTEEKSFGGSREMLKSICALGVPVLRKDFLNTVEEIRETKELGASAVLLMYSCLPDEKIKELFDEAKKIGLDVLLETHTREQLEKAISLGAKLIGINNRDITVLERDNGDVSLTEKLAALKPDDAFLVSESSISSPDEVRKAIAAGADAALVGTAVLKAPDPGSYYKKLCRKNGIKLCGMTKPSDMKLCENADILGVVLNYPRYVPWDIKNQTTGGGDYLNLENAVKAVTTPKHPESTPEEAALSLAAEILKAAPYGCETCIVTGGTPEHIISLGKELKPDYVQIHYKENLEETCRAAEGLKGNGIRVIRSLPDGMDRIREQFGKELPGFIPEELQSDEAYIRAFSEILKKSGVVMLLADARNGDNADGKNLSAPLEFFSLVKQSSVLPVMLAGGINPDNIGKIRDASNAELLDIMSGIENSPCDKSEEKIRLLFKNIE